MHTQLCLLCKQETDIIISFQVKRGGIHNKWSTKDACEIGRLWHGKSIQPKIMIFISEKISHPTQRVTITLSKANSSITHDTIEMCYNRETIISNA